MHSSYKESPFQKELGWDGATVPGHLLELQQFLCLVFLIHDGNINTHCLELPKVLETTYILCQVQECCPMRVLKVVGNWAGCLLWISEVPKIRVCSDLE